MKQVLVVDDDPTIRDVIGDAMREEGFNVSFAHSGLTTSQQIATGHPDLVILDVMIPEGDGRQVLHEMQSRQDLRDIPVIMVITGEMFERKDHGVVTYLAKPFALDYLVHLVVDAIGAPD
jgi:two-component system, OmpR family, response regulator